MGGRTKLKIQEREAMLEKQQAFLFHGSKKYKFPPAPTPLEDYVSQFSNKFVRNPKNFVLKTKSSNRYKQLLELVKFVFAKYPVPKILDQAWMPLLDKNTFRVIHPSYDINFLDWYICVATGGSLYKTHAKNIFTKKEVHNFLNAPSQLTLIQGLHYAIAKSAGANDNISYRISRSKITEKPFDDFWRNCVRFFATNCPNSLNDLNDVIDYVTFKHIADAKYTLFGSGHSTNSLLKKMHEWHADMRRTKAIGEARWDGHPIIDQTLEGQVNGHKVFWDFVQIKSAGALAAEGNAMRHCVFAYKYSCASGAISIWSLCMREYEYDTPKRRITIELRNDGSIAQARGLANRSPRTEEKNIIYKWAHRNGLTANLY